MGMHQPPEITEEDRGIFARDGAVCLRGVYDPAETAGKSVV